MPSDITPLHFLNEYSLIDGIRFGFFKKKAKLKTIRGTLIDSKYAMAMYINFGPSIFLIINNEKINAEDDISEKEVPNIFLF